MRFALAVLLLVSFPAPAQDNRYCLLGLEQVRLSDSAIAALSRAEKVAIATNNALIESCSGSRID